MSELRLARVILRVSDLDRSVGFWVDQVGLTLLRRAGVFAFLATGSCELMLNESPSYAGDPSLTELVLETDDVEAAYAELATRGVAFETELRPVMGTEGRRLVAAHFRDPDRHLVSLTGWIE